MRGAHFVVQYRNGRECHDRVSRRNWCIGHHFQTGHASRGVADAEWGQDSLILEAVVFLAVTLHLER